MSLLSLYYWSTMKRKNPNKRIPQALDLENTASCLDCIVQVIQITQESTPNRQEPIQYFVTL